MKALVYTGPQTSEIQDMDKPIPKDNEVLVEIHACGICGSDMHAYLGHDERRLAPLILGHEASGVVMSSGPDKGRRVTINPLVSCGQCIACQRGRDNLCPHREIISMMPRQGAFAQFIAMPRQNLVDVPDHVSFAQAALAEPIACGWHAMRMCQPHLDNPLDRVRAIVFGGGAIGLGSALSLRANGVNDLTIIEPNADRAKQISDIDGINICSTSTDIGADVDLVIDGVGIADTRDETTRILRPGGVCAHIGLGSGRDGLDIRRMTLQELTFIGTYTYRMQDFQETCQAIFDGRLGSLDWIDEVPLDKGPQRFSALANGLIATPKTILCPQTFRSH